ncbi:hypothetical protein BD311DRAFT_752953 [Dichomitus squalens]|uniref:MARVEL domain-containing protein n=1 Tax=Dichomitus squalens TaxID=114155 RepID=A0A4Q9MY71_9APHY|nr:hypothetical protein BD311DRAFT_752953 [Dichomitus squalens]
MGLVFFYRLASLALATITAVIVLGLCVSSTTAFHKLLSDPELAGISATLTYANLGIAAGAMVIISLPAMLFVDFINDGRIGLPILIEIPWLCVLWIMFIATGLSTKHFTDGPGKLPSGVTCDDGSTDEARTLCHEWDPIQIISYITAGLLFLYTITLLGVSTSRAYGGKSMWGTSVKNSEL